VAISVSRQKTTYTLLPKPQQQIEMGRKMLALVPSELPTSANLGRFHSDATEQPLLTVVTWTCRSSGNSLRARQLALSSDKAQLLELQRLQPPEGARSWFVGNTVLQDGGVTVFSKIDPLFVLFHAAWAQKSRFMSVYDLLSADNNTWLLQLSALKVETIEKICEVQDVDGESGVDNAYVKASEKQMTQWLRAKVEKVAAALAKHEHGAAKATAVDGQVNLPDQKTEQKTKSSKAEHHYREAIDVVANYLPEDWVNLLCNEFK
jgi:hypothetical protein